MKPDATILAFDFGTQRIGGGPGPEQRFVRASLAQSPDIVVSRRLINYEPPGVDIADMIGKGAPSASGDAGDMNDHRREA